MSPIKVFPEFDCWEDLPTANIAKDSSMTGMLEEEGAISDELVYRVRSLTRRIKEMEEEHKEKERLWENKSVELR